MYNHGSQIYCADVAQLVEHLICNQAVGGSSPLISSIIYVKQCLTRNDQVESNGELLKRPKRADCKSAGFYLRRFESFTHHHLKSLGTKYAGIAQLARASAFQAEGRRFESGFPLHLNWELSFYYLFICFHLYL